MAGRSENGRLAEPERTKTMKKILIALAVLALAGSAYAAQKSDATLKDVRNPRVLATIINANAADAESRLTSAVTETLAVTGNTTLNGTLTMSTNKFTVSTAGAVVAASTVTMASPVFTAEAVAAPTNSASAGFAVTVNGTNYWLALYPAND